LELIWESSREAFRVLFEMDPKTLGVILLSLRVSGLAVLIGLVIGVPAGIALGLHRFRGRQVIMAIVNTGLGLPPVVVGLFVYMMLSRRGPLGGLEWLFTVPAMITAQVILATPYITAITTSAVASIPREFRLQALGLGASRRQALWIVIKEARLSIMTAVIAGFGAVISEVGAVMMVGGNIATTEGNRTQVLTTAIMLEVRKGNFALAMAFGMILMLLAFIMVLLLTRMQEGSGGRWVQS